MAAQCFTSTCFLFVVLTAVRGWEIIEPPKDVVRRAGGDLRLRCKVQESGDMEFVEWKEFVSSEAGQRIWLSNNPTTIVHPNTTKYNIADTYDLIIREAKIQDGGHYGCKLLVSEATYHFAEVVLFEKAQCIDTSYLSDEINHISCTVPYGGNGKPSVQYYDEHDRPVDISSEVQGKHHVKITSNVSTTWADDGRQYTCRVAISTPLPYNDSCSVTLNIPHSVRNMTVNTDRDVIYVGEQLNCSASGNPHPHYQWKQLSPPEGRNVSGETLTVTRSMMGDNTWICTAWNTLNCTVYNVSTDVNFRVEERPVGGGSVIQATATFTLVVFVVAMLVTGNFR